MNNNCLDDPSQIPVDGRTSLVIRFVVDLAVALSVILGNAFIVTAIFTFRHRTNNTLLRVSNVSNRFLLNLALADLLVGLCAVYCLTPYYLCSVARRMDSTRDLCVLRFVLPIFSAMTSVSSLGAISVDRYVAIVHSLRYRTLMCEKRTTAILCLPWLFSGLAAFSLLFWNHYEAGVACSDRVIPVAFVCAIGVPHSFLVLLLVGLVHFRIRREVLASRIRRKSMESGQAAMAAVRIGSSLDQHPQRSEDVRKSARVLLTVVGCFFVTYTPMCVLFTSRMAGLRGDLLDLAFELSFTLANVNSLLNPFIYSWQNVTVHTAIKHLSARCPRCCRPGLSSRTNGSFTAASSSSGVSARGALIASAIVDKPGCLQAGGGLGSVQTDRQRLGARIVGGLPPQYIRGLSVDSVDTVGTQQHFG